MSDDLVYWLQNPACAFLVDEVTMHEAAAEIIRLRAERDALQSRVAELEGVLLDARDDLTEWIDFAHQSHIMQDFENDMAIVRRIDAALEGGKS